MRRLLLLLAATVALNTMAFARPALAHPQWGAYDEGHAWHNDDWWFHHHPDWVYQHHHEWIAANPGWGTYGDWDETHHWHDRHWWLEHHRRWVEEHHHDWY